MLPTKGAATATPGTSVATMAAATATAIAATPMTMKNPIATATNTATSTSSSTAATATTTTPKESLEFSTDPLILARQVVSDVTEWWIHHLLQERNPAQFSVLETVLPHLSPLPKQSSLAAQLRILSLWQEVLNNTHLGGDFSMLQDKLLLLSTFSLFGKSTAYEECMELLKVHEQIAKLYSGTLVLLDSTTKSSTIGTSTSMDAAPWGSTEEPQHAIPSYRQAIQAIFLGKESGVPALLLQVVEDDNPQTIQASLQELVMDQNNNNNNNNNNNPFSYTHLQDQMQSVLTTWIQKGFGTPILVHLGYHVNRPSDTLESFRGSTHSINNNNNNKDIDSHADQKRSTPVNILRLLGPREPDGKTPRVPTKYSQVATPATAASRKQARDSHSRSHYPTFTNQNLGKFKSSSNTQNSRTHATTPGTTHGSISQLPSTTMETRSSSKRRREYTTTTMDGSSSEAETEVHPNRNTTNNDNDNRRRNKNSYASPPPAYYGGRQSATHAMEPSGVKPGKRPRRRSNENTSPNKVHMEDEYSSSSDTEEFIRARKRQRRVGEEWKTKQQQGRRLQELSLSSPNNTQRQEALDALDRLYKEHMERLQLAALGLQARSLGSHTTHGKHSQPPPAPPRQPPPPQLHDEDESHHKRRSFSKEESDAICQGVALFGNRWGHIKKHFGDVLATRSAVAIKDRARTLVKQSKLDPSSWLEHDDDDNEEEKVQKGEDNDDDDEEPYVEHGVQRTV